MGQLELIKQNKSFYYAKKQVSAFLILYLISIYLFCNIHCL